MPNVKRRTVKSLDDFVKEIGKALDRTRARSPSIASAMNWYRGVSKSNTHKLQPSLFRLPSRLPLDYLNLEANMMKDFQRQVLLHGHTATPSGSESANLLTLFYMQHYGVPTRLLDWSANPLIALYFALSNDTVSPENPAVWVLDPWAWNRNVFRGKSWLDRGPANTRDAAIDGYVPREAYENSDLIKMEEHPVAILGTYNTERMRAQRGVFTIFGKDASPLDDIFTTGAFAAESLTVIEVERLKAADVFGRLLAMGYTDSVSYPDLHGVAMEIKRTYGYLT